MTNLKISKSFILFAYLIFSLVACGAPPTPKLPLSQAEGLRTVVVWPADAYCEEGSPIPFYCPVKAIIPGEISTSAKEVMNALIRSALEPYSQKHFFMYLTEVEAELLLEKVLEGKVADPAAAVRLIAQETKATSILYPRIYKFRERVGKGMGVTEPASVAFALFLYDGSSGKLIWYDFFDETQKPLSENLLNLSLYRSIKWLTAEELARNGLERMLKRSLFAR